MANQSQQQSQSPEDIAGQFSPEEMEQVKRYGQALGGGPTAFDEQVQDHLDLLYKHRPPGEAGARKERAAQTGGASDTGLGPSDIERAQMQEGPAIAQKQAQQSAQQASQAQASAQPVNAPPAPSSAVGTSQPYSAQRGPQPPPESGAQDVEPEVPGIQSPGAQAGGAGGPPPAPGGQEQS